MLGHIRFHGRGGEGVKLTSRIVSRAAFLAGHAVQDSSLYGPERRGAPVVAFTRVSRQPILERGYIDTPDALVIMDASLLGRADAGVLRGVAARGLVLVNTPRSAEDLRTRHDIPGHLVTLDVSSIALDLLGHHLLSAPMAGCTVKLTATAPWDLVAEAVRIELADIGLTAELIERNLTATRRAFDAAPALDPSVAPAPPPSTGNGASAQTFVLPRLPAGVAGPSIEVGGTSALRSTDGWRVFRPEVDRARCTRCFICFVFCPDGAIQLDADSYPVIDYAHCKGCLVCATECPPQAIAAVREAAA